MVLDGRLLLFTADAGVTALSGAADVIEASLPGVELRLVQIPHHGSKRNVGPKILDSLVGRAVPGGRMGKIQAVACTAKRGEPKHPSRAVMNAFTHRGARAYATRGCTLLSRYGTERRGGWESVEPEQYHETFEEEG